MSEFKLFYLVTLKECHSSPSVEFRVRGLTGMND